MSLRTGTKTPNLKRLQIHQYLSGEKKQKKTKKTKTNNKKTNDTASKKLTFLKKQKIKIYMNTNIQEMKIHS